MAKTGSRKTDNAFDLEQSMAELEAIVERMEHGELSLEQALADFERGVQLSRSCHQALGEAEQKVRLLLEKNGLEELVPFALKPNADDADDES
ncbi:MAG: exodeoxyribonuclease VII small subunit [Thiohalomonadaceae bacterium]